MADAGTTSGLRTVLVARPGTAPGVPETIVSGRSTPTSALTPRGGRTVVDAPPAGARFGRWVVERPLGRGGMGVVMLAHDADRPWAQAALKISRASRIGERDGPATRLAAESMALASVASPHVVRCYEFGVCRQGRAWMAMEYVPGPTLRRLARGKAGPVSTPMLLSALRDVAAGLDAVHRAGILHRDVKSSNIVVGTDGRARILDFGLALRRGAVDPGMTDSHDGGLGTEADDDALTQARLTRAGATIGTPAYMAPEQHMGHCLDDRCDQFAFAVTAYETLLARRPYEGPTPQAYLDQKISGRLPSPACGARLCAGSLAFAAIARGLAPDPADRWASVPTMAAALVAG